MKQVITKIIVILIIIVYGDNDTNKCFAQEDNSKFQEDKSWSKKEAIIIALSDTLNPEIYLIPLKINYRDSVFITYDHALYLYKYFHEKYGWDREYYIQQISTSFIIDEPIVINDFTFLENRKKILASECNCLFNEDQKRLKQRVRDEDFPIFPDKRFLCFLYQCMNHGVILCATEERIMYQKNIY